MTVSLLAGVLGTGIGGLVGALFSERDDSSMGRILGFAGGVMLGVVCFEMMPEAVTPFAEVGRWGFLCAIGCAAAGGLAIAAINALLDLVEKKQAGYMFRQQAVISSLKERKRKIKNGGLFKAGLIMFIAISLHNVPEGMAIGASGTKELSMGVTVALVLAVHNVPEGMAIGAPLATSGVSRWLAVLLSVLAGGATAIGAAAGQLLGGLGDLATGICLAVASGAMLYVTSVNMLTEATSLCGKKFPSLSLLLGIACAAAFVYAL